MPRMDRGAPALQSRDGRAQFYKSGSAVNRRICLRHRIRLASAMRPPWTGAHHNVAGPPQMLGQPLGREPGREIPPAAPRLAPLVIAQRVRQHLGDFLRCRRGQVEWIGVRLGLVGHGGKLGWTSERNKN